MPDYLQPGVNLVLRDTYLALERQGVSVSHCLQPGEAVALSLLAATGSVTESRSLFAECLPNADVWMDRVLDRYPTYLGEGIPRALDLDLLNQVLQPRGSFPIVGNSHQRDAAPASLTWLVTMGCNRHCPYCFFDVFTHPADAPSPPDTTFSIAAIQRLLHEMAQIGTSHLYLTGGEPLLRTDLPDIIALATAKRIRTHISTKLLIRPNLAARLAEAGLTEATVSIDDARPKFIDLMAGSVGYSHECRETLIALTAAGIPVEVNAVVTAWNGSHLDGLCRWLIDLGVPALKLARFNPPYPRPSPVERMQTDVSIDDLIARLSSEFGHRLNIRAEISSLGEGEEARCGNSLVCEVGVRTLDILPDGSVTRCHYLPNQTGLIVGSLERQSLLDIWNRVQAPQRDSYEGNACHDCDGFQACNDRGRCYVSAMIQSGGSLHAPDRFCTA